MDGGLWHQPGQRSGRRRARAAKVGGVLGAGIPLGVVAVRLLTRRHRAQGSAGADQQRS
jgi:hypothetical protein